MKIVPKLVALLMLASSPAFAQQMGRGQPPLLSGQVAENNVEKLTSTITWHHSLADAEAEARRQNKMIVWVHMLGQMDGAT